MLSSSGMEQLSFALVLPRSYKAEQCWCTCVQSIWMPSRKVVEEILFLCCLDCGQAE